MEKITMQADYVSLLSSIKTEIWNARIKAARIVNRELIFLYWKIGEMIVQKQKELGWGKSVVEKLSKDIRTEFDGIHGFSPQNLWNMRQFYTEYFKHPILQQLVGELPWGHNLLIMNKINDPKNIRRPKMRENKEFSLSYYFDEMEQKAKSKSIRQTGAAQKMGEGFSTTALLSVIRELKKAEDNKLDLISLARAIKIKIARCQEIADQLKKENLVKIVPDETGNDIIQLTQKGTEML